MVGFLVAGAMCGGAAVAAVRVAYIPNARNHAGWHAVFWRDEDVPGCAGNATSGDNVRQQTTMRPFCQTMRHCCQLIPLQITPPFIVSSLALSLFLSLSISMSFSLFLFLSRARSLARFSTPFRNPDVGLLSHSWALVINCCPSLSLYFSSYSLLLISLISLHMFFFLVPCLSWILFLYSELSFFRVLFLFCFHFALLTLLLRTLRRSHRGRPSFKGCIWDRSDKRNCANKYTSADNCTINLSWLVKTSRLNALTCSRYG